MHDSRAVRRDPNQRIVLWTAAIDLAPVLLRRTAYESMLEQGELANANGRGHVKTAGRVLSAAVAFAVARVAAGLFDRGADVVSGGLERAVTAGRTVLARSRGPSSSCPPRNGHGT